MVVAIARRHGATRPNPTVEIRRSALIGRPAASTFDLIEAAEHYPDFLPWCTDAVILARDVNVVVARLTLNYHGLHFDLTTRNLKRRPHSMAIRLERGPFRRFEGEWQVVALSAEACKIEFTLRYVVDYRKRRWMKDHLFTRILEEVDKSGNQIRLASATFELVPGSALDVRLSDVEKRAP